MKIREEFIKNIISAIIATIIIQIINGVDGNTMELFFVSYFSCTIWGVIVSYFNEPEIYE